MAAVQALYQLEMTGEAAGEVIREFMQHRIGEPKSGRPTDVALFSDLVSGVMRDPGPVDARIAGLLVSGWNIDRLEVTLRAILRLGVYELAHHEATPAEVVIAEYVDIAQAFHDERAAGLVNGVLDSVSGELRSPGPESRE